MEAAVKSSLETGNAAKFTPPSVANVVRRIDVFLYAGDIASFSPVACNIADRLDKRGLPRAESVR